MQAEKYYGNITFPFHKFVNILILLTLRKKEIKKEISNSMQCTFSLG